MRFSQINGPLLRAVGVVSAVGVLVTGVTFATLQSQQAVLAGNTIQSATADIKIGTSATSFAASRNGFTFDTIVPGGPAMPADGVSIYLKNYGTASLTLKLTGGGSLTNASNIDLSKVKFQVSRMDSGAEQPAQTVDIQTLATTGMALTDPLAPTAVAQYKLRAAMDGDAFSGQSASVGGIDLVFSGAAN
jgi:hypothetical protein